MNKFMPKSAFQIIMAIIYSFFILASAEAYAGSPNVITKGVALDYLSILDKSAKIFV